MYKAALHDVVVAKETIMTEFTTTIKIVEPALLKRLPAYLKNKLNQAMEQFSQERSTHLICEALKFSSEFNLDAFNLVLQELTQLLYKFESSNDERSTSFIYEFLLYFSNIISWNLPGW